MPGNEDTGSEGVLVQMRITMLDAVGEAEEEVAGQLSAQGSGTSPSSGVSEPLDSLKTAAAAKASGA